MLSSSQTRLLKTTHIAIVAVIADVVSYTSDSAGALLGLVACYAWSRKVWALLLVAHRDALERSAVHGKAAYASSEKNALGA